MQEPFRVIPLEYARVESRQHATWRLVTTMTIALSWLCCVVGTGLIIAVDVETVEVTGPILLSCGVVIIIGALVLNKPLALSIGMAHCAICFLFVGLVNLLHWGPHRAAEPFLWMGSIYCVAITLPVWLAVFRSAK